MENFELLFENCMANLCRENPDPSHDLLHIKRVVGLAKKLANLEGGNLAVVVPAAYLHDCIYVSKADSRRTQASRLSADKALELLKSWNYPEEHFPAIYHAICAHSFSSGVKAESLETKIVQDADRLDAIGAVGIIRCFSLSGLSLRPFYNSEDPFCSQRLPDDQTNTLDHFFTKLLNLEKRLNTQSAKQEAAKRVNTMNEFLESLRAEIN